MRMNLHYVEFSTAIVEYHAALFLSWSGWHGIVHHGWTLWQRTSVGGSPYSRIHMQKHLGPLDWSIKLLVSFEQCPNLTFGRSWVVFPDIMNTCLFSFFPAPLKWRLVGIFQPEQQQGNLKASALDSVGLLRFSWAHGMISCLIQNHSKIIQNQSILIMLYIYIIMCLQYIYIYIAIYILFAMNIRLDSHGILPSPN